MCRARNSSGGGLGGIGGGSAGLGGWDRTPESAWGSPCSRVQITSALQFEDSGYCCNILIYYSSNR